MKSKMIAGSILLFGSMAANSQICDTVNIQLPTTPIERFLDIGDGTVTDIKTGIVWDKCSYGQEYSSDTNTCLGDPTPVADWTEALAIAQAAGDDKRLPNIKELGSIVERQCSFPSINLAVFSGTPSAGYISSTPSANTGTTTYRTVNFGTGEDFVSEVATQRYVRLMKNAK